MAISRFERKPPVRQATLPGHDAESRMEHLAFAKHLQELVAGGRFELTKGRERPAIQDAKTDPALPAARVRFPARLVCQGRTLRSRERK